uniref:Uncharacterized protein n=1 Tax=Zooxanthella nutricula TaxID=1333877 RepID=A0A7S2LH31_9DINO
MDAIEGGGGASAGEEGGAGAASARTSSGSPHEARAATRTTSPPAPRSASASAAARAADGSLGAASSGGVAVATTTSTTSTASTRVGKFWPPEHAILAVTDGTSTPPPPWGRRPEGPAHGGLGDEGGGIDAGAVANAMIGAGLLVASIATLSVMHWRWHSAAQAGTTTVYLNKLSVFTELDNKEAAYLNKLAGYTELENKEASPRALHLVPGKEAASTARTKVMARSGGDQPSSPALPSGRSSPPAAPQSQPQSTSPLSFRNPSTPSPTGPGPSSPLPSPPPPRATPVGRLGDPLYFL